ncbi:RICIN domain-containing protein [Longispora sp. K20-0274]|uniref:RICIN domain-containing protein n=1 Tax=Longispora sp. K20-0274 TaxID=3088255 RepID=UPI00399B67EC
MRSTRMLAVLVAFASVLAGGFLAAEPAAASAPPASDNGKNLYSAAFLLVNGYSNNCVDVAGKSRRSGARIQEWGCGGSGDPQQQWLAEPIAAAPGYVALRNINSNRCMDLRVGSDDDVGNGTLIQQWDCVPDAYHSERWQIVPSSTYPGWSMLVTWVKGLCLQFDGARTGNGTAALVSDCDGGDPNQVWFQRTV